MRSRHAHLGAVLAALIVSLVMAGAASAAVLRGVVVHRDHRAHSFVIAMSGGRLAAVHARRSPAVGRRVRAVAKRLRNGTYGAREVRVGGRARGARLRGVVTFVNRRRGMFAVSSLGASVLVLRRDTASAADALPSVGEDVTVEVGIDDQGELEDQDVQGEGVQTSGIDLEGTILSIDATARTLTVSADDDEQAGQSLLVHVPMTIDISTFKVGDEVELVVALQPDGSFLLQGSSDDDNAEEANNPQDEQGCQHDAGDAGSAGTTCTATSGGGGGE